MASSAWCKVIRVHCPNPAAAQIPKQPTSHELKYILGDGLPNGRETSTPVVCFAQIAVTARRRGERIKYVSKRAFLFGLGTEGLRQNRSFRCV
jgi:hypothetical protein